MALFAIVLGAAGLPRGMLTALGGGLGLLNNAAASPILPTAAAIVPPWIDLILGLLHLLVASLLLVSGIRLWKRGSSARRLVIIAFGTALVFELLRIGPSLMQQGSSSELLDSLLASQSSSDRPISDEVKQAMSRLLTSVTITGWVTETTYTLLKLTLYAVGIHYWRTCPE